MLEKMPLETPEGQQYAEHKRNSISRYVMLAEYPRWQRLIYRGWLYVVPWLIYKVYEGRICRVALPRTKLSRG
ncbi:hypothetical protein [Actinopolymorpha pittospori]|uniref:Uncharacterized protein n=1 Tax=Actinopolymorpha pittospori TaxID=648752 RepID=A0A927N7B1_9ACTN|nr:hypothetical protein [Actinopolymorpha pittospori]MBE1609790.1 hypothetical protein [Actinopolymorpha pittospori]